MPNSGRPTIGAALLLSLALAGCHSTLGTSPVDLGPGRGRVDRSFPVGLLPTTRALLESLDELGVRPRAMTFRTIGSDPSEQAVIRVSPIPATNAEILTGKLFTDLLAARPNDRARVGGRGASIPCDPVLLSYKGAAGDGRDVVVIARSEELDIRRDAGTLVMARVGPNGDETWGGALLDKVAARLPGPPAGPPPATPAPPK